MGNSITRWELIWGKYEIRPTYFTLQYTVVNVDRYMADGPSALTDTPIEPRLPQELLVWTESDIGAFDIRPSLT